MRLRFWTVGAGLALCAGATAIHGCNSTSGGLIPYLPVEIGGADREASGPMTFSTQAFGPQGCGRSAAGYACGWQVELDQAGIAVGPSTSTSPRPARRARSRARSSSR